MSNFIDENLTPRRLTLMVNKIPGVDMGLRGVLFGTSRKWDTRYAKVDIRTGNLAILAALGINDPSHVRQRSRKATVVFELPRFAEKTLLRVAEMVGRREVGSQTMLENMLTEVAVEQGIMVADLEQTREYLAVGAIKGNVIDGAGNSLINYASDIPTSHKPSTTAGEGTHPLAAEYWTENTSNPITQLRTWKRTLRRACPNSAGARFYCFCGHEVMDALIEHPTLVELQRNQRGVQLMESGRVATVAGITFMEYEGSYQGTGIIRQSGTARVDMIGSKEMFLVLHKPEWFVEHFWPTVSEEDSRGVGSRRPMPPAGMYFSEQWRERDPSGRWIKVECNVAPVVHVPEAVMQCAPVGLAE